MLFFKRKKKKNKNKNKNQDRTVIQSNVKRNDEGTKNDWWIHNMTTSSATNSSSNYSDYDNSNHSSMCSSYDSGSYNDSSSSCD